MFRIDMVGELPEASLVASGHVIEEGLADFRDLLAADAVEIPVRQSQHDLQPPLVSGNPSE